MPAAARLDAVFAALSDRSRRTIVERLASGEATVGTVARPLRMTPPSVSKHVKILERAGLIERRLKGREHWLRLTPQGLKSAAEWVITYDRFWNESLDRLDELIGNAGQVGSKAPLERKTRGAK